MTLQRLYILLIVYVNFSCVLSAQNHITQAAAFSKHLVQQKKYDDALYAIKKILPSVPDITGTADSLHYYMAYCYLKLNRQDSAKHYFSLTAHSANNSLKEKSIAFYNHISIHQLDSIIKVEDNASSYAKEINRVQALASLLLLHNLKGFKEQFDKEKCKFTDLAAVEFDLMLRYYDLSRLRKKNRYLAGTLSAVVPGLGKLYTGKKHEALIAALPVIFNGAQAYEGYYHRKLKSPHFYVFGSIGMVFYLSNIYGSARSAVIINEEKYEEIRIKIFNDLDSIVAKF